MSPETGHLTRLLNRWATGDAQAADELFDIVYPELCRLAGIAIRSEWESHSWQRTALVNEAFLRLLGEARPQWENRGLFFAHAVTTIRRILIEKGRQRRTLKRWGRAERVELHPEFVAVNTLSEDILEVSLAIDRIRETDPRGALIVELRFFLGLKHSEIASILDVSARTVERDFEFARASLRRLLSVRRDSGLSS